MSTPAKGLRFLHSRQIDGSPKAGTASPVEMEVTAVRRGIVYFRRADYPGTKAAWCIEVSLFHTVAKEES
jgi:hypothetical protein